MQPSLRLSRSRPILCEESDDARYTPPSRVARTLSAVLTALVFAACADNVTDLLLPETSQTAGSTAALRQTEGEFHSIPRVDVRIEATGPFLPGVPIAVTARATARRVAQNADVELLVLDPGPRIPRARWASR